MPWSNYPAALKKIQTEWLEYLAAKDRLVLAYAEQSTTA
jgi:hypothetical protein